MSSPDQENLQLLWTNQLYGTDIITVLCTVFRYYAPRSDEDKIIYKNSISVIALWISEPKSDHIEGHSKVKFDRDTKIMKMN